MGNIFLSPSKAKLKPFRDQNSSSRDRFPHARLHSRPIDENLLAKPPFELLLPRRLVLQRHIEIGHDEFHHHAEGIGVGHLTLGQQNDGISHRLQGRRSIGVRDLGFYGSVNGLTLTFNQALSAVVLI